MPGQCFRQSSMVFLPGSVVRETLVLLAMSFSFSDAMHREPSFLKIPHGGNFVLSPWLRRFFVTGSTIGLSRDPWI